MHARTWFFFAFACLSGCAAQTEVIIDPAPPPPDADEPEIVILGYDAAPPTDLQVILDRPVTDAGVPPVDVPLAMDTGSPPPPASRLCQACVDNTSCDTGGVCIHDSRDGSQFCGTACGGGCPAGYACAALMAGTGTVQQCVPTSGRCAGLPTPTDAGTSTNPYLCAACTSAAQCGAGGLCLRDARTLNIFCGTPCGAGCPADFTCSTVAAPSGTTQLCTPTTGTCPGAPPPIDAGTPDIPAPDVASPPPVDAGPVTLTVGTNTVAIGSRQAILYVPSARIQAGIVLLHGNGDTAMNFLLTSGFREVASAQNVALIVPLAISGSGPMGVDWDAYTRPSSSNADVTLALGARDYLVRGGVDAHRTFLVGYSQGGYLAYHVAMVGSAQFGAATVAAAADPLPGLNLAGMATRHLPIDLLIGTGDYGIANAQRTRDDLRARGFEVRYTELPGVGHCCPLNGRASDIWTWLSARPLP